MSCRACSNYYKLQQMVDAYNVRHQYNAVQHYFNRNGLLMLNQYTFTGRSYVDDTSTQVRACLRLPVRAGYGSQLVGFVHGGSCS